MEIKKEIEKLERKETMMYRGKEIVTSIYPKQSSEYYKALEEKDGYMVHMLHQPAYIVPFWMIQSEMRHIDLIEDYKEEQERIDKMSPEMLRIEIELGFKKK